MSNIEKLKAEVERLKQITERRIENNSYTINDIGLDDDERKRVHRLQDDKLTHLTGGLCMCDKILSFIDSLPKEPVSEDLKDNSVQAVIWHPFSRFDFPNIVANYMELKEYLEKYDIKDGDEVIVQIRKKEE